MHALVHRDYQVNKAEVIRQQVEFLWEHPEEEPYVSTMFDYTRGPVSVLTKPIRPECAQLSTFDGVNCSEHVARALRSSGRTDMHLLFMPERIGLTPTSRMFPMRSDSSALHDGVRQLAAETPRPKDLSLRIRQLLDATSAVLEIH